MINRFGQYAGFGQVNEEAIHIRAGTSIVCFGVAEERRPQPGGASYLCTDAFYRPDATALRKTGDEVVLYVDADIAGVHATDVDAVPARAVVDVIVRNRYAISSGAGVDQDPGPTGGETSRTAIRDTCRILFQAEGLNDKPCSAGHVKAGHVVPG